MRSKYLIIIILMIKYIIIYTTIHIQGVDNEKIITFYYPHIIRINVTILYTYFHKLYGR